MKNTKTERVDKIRQIGETVSVEFKRCGGNIEHDVYETVCSFSNRFGGAIIPTNIQVQIQNFPKVMFLELLSH